MSTIRIGPDRHGRVVFVRDETVAERPETTGPEVVHLACPDAVIRPGRVCSHTHLYSGLAPFGLPAPEDKPTNFVEILERVWWRLDRALDADSLAAAARYYIGSALLAGTTSLVDHQESPQLIEGSLDVLGDAFDDLGMRGLLCFGITERNDGRDEAARGLAEGRRFIEENRRTHVRGLIGIHASFTVSDESVRESAALARELDTALHIHVAEAASDVIDARRRGYDGVIDRLEKLDALVPRSILAHGVHLAPDEVRRASDGGAWFVHNPRSNQGNQVGFSAVLASSDRVGLGTDGFPAFMDDEIAAARELLAAYGQNPRLAVQREVTGRALVSDFFDKTAIRGLDIGDAADIIAVGDDGSAVHTIVGGRIAVRDGNLVGASLDTLRTQAEAEAERLWARMRTL